MGQYFVSTGSIVLDAFFIFIGIASVIGIAYNVREIIQESKKPRKKPVYKEGTSLFSIIQDGVSRDFKNEQIIYEAGLNGYKIDDKLVDAVRRDFNVRMEEFFKNEQRTQEVL